MPADLVKRNRDTAFFFIIQRSEWERVVLYSWVRGSPDYKAFQSSIKREEETVRERECTGEVLVMWDQWTAQEIWWPLSHLWGLPRTVPCAGFSSRFYQVQKDKSLVGVRG